MVNPNGDALQPELNVPGFVRSHRVYYLAGPIIELLGEKRIKVALEVQLRAAHDRGAAALPGCSKCEELISGLRKIAERLCATAAVGPSEVEPFDKALRASTRLDAVDEVALSVEFLRPEGPLSPVNERDIERCAKALKTALSMMGIFEGGWRQSAS